MKGFCNLWTALWVVLVVASNPQLCAAGSTKTARREFVRAMDQALGQKKRSEIFHSRLRQLAIPAEKHPGYMRSLGLKSEESRKLEEDWEFFAIDLSEYAMKYIGCSNIRTWSDDLAAEDNSNSVLKMEQFVVLRLCPRDSCSNYNQYGCMEQFGDYLIPMQTYLQTMSETYFSQYEQYCETCYECITGNKVEKDDDDNYNNAAENYYYTYYDNVYGGDDATNYYNQYSGYYNGGGNYNRYQGNYNNGGRRLNDDYNDVANDDAVANDDDSADDAAADDAAVDDANVDDYYANQNNDDGHEYNPEADCEYYSICANYQSACQEYSSFGYDLEDYFSCAEFSIGNSAGYLGPHCASDGKTISLGIFSDENCNDYSADFSKISSYMSVDADELEPYYSDNCISCLASDGYVLEVENNDDGSNAVADICGALYDDSAKCNKYMGNDGDYSHSNQESQEDTVCNFIENLLKNSYDEYGEVVLEEIGWKTYIPTAETVSAMKTWQKCFLTLGFLSCAGMFAVACYLYREIRMKRGTWYPRPRKGYSTYPGVGPTSMEGRLHSGIIQGRSHSSSFEMKNGGVLG